MAAVSLPARGPSPDTSVSLKSLPGTCRSAARGRPEQVEHASAIGDVTSTGSATTRRSGRRRVSPARHPHRERARMMVATEHFHPFRASLIGVRRTTQTTSVLSEQAALLQVGEQRSDRAKCEFEKRHYDDAVGGARACPSRGDRAARSARRARPAPAPAGSCRTTPGGVRCRTSRANSGRFRRKVGQLGTLDCIR